MSGIPLLTMSFWSNWMAPLTLSTPLIQLLSLKSPTSTIELVLSSVLHALSKWKTLIIMTGQGKHQKFTMAHFDISFPILKSQKLFFSFNSQCYWPTHVCASSNHFKTHLQRIKVFEYDFTVKGFQSMIIIFHCLLTRIYISKVIVGNRTLILSFKHKMRPLNLINFLEAMDSLRNKIYPWITLKCH